eukprot:5364959-Heterocapsa_arctica.AAC.1
MLPCIPWCDLITPDLGRMWKLVTALGGEAFHAPLGEKPGGERIPMRFLEQRNIRTDERRNH